MNETQKQSVDLLQKNNNKYIKQLNKLNKDILKNYEKFENDETKFFDLFNKMEKAHSGLPYLPFHNYYCIVNGTLANPSLPLILNDRQGKINEQFIELSDEWINNTSEYFESVFSKLYKELVTVSNTFVKLKNDILAGNSITQRLSGLEGKLEELNKSMDLFWYPKKLSEIEYSFTGQKFIIPSFLSQGQVKTAIPFHREFMIKYEYLFKTMSIHIALPEKIKGILLSINQYLPFAELIPLTNNSNHIKVEHNYDPKQIYIGSNNTFDGEVKIGHEGVAQ